jgi:hypothetical protein
MRQREEMERDWARRNAEKREWDDDQERLARGEIIVESTFDADPF